MMKKVYLIVILICGFISFTGLRCESDSLKGIEFFTGYSKAKLKSDREYWTVPLIVSFDFDIKSLAGKTGFEPSGLVHFQIEPFFAFVVEPSKNIEVGNTFFFKIGLLPENKKIQPYIKPGVGVSYTTQHLEEQATQFNFISNLGVGAHYFFDKNNAVNLEYRFRHLSNAGIKHPNNGIDSHFFCLGITRLF